MEESIETDRILFKLVKRFAYVRPDNLSVFADRFVEWTGHTEIPRVPGIILEAYGITFTVKSLRKGWAGHWHKTPEGYQVFLNEQDDPHRRIFTAYHEVFEIICQSPAFPKGSLSKQELHRMADQFSAAVLMPEKEVRRIAAEYHHPPLDKTSVLAEKFGVSYSAMKVRLKQFELIPNQEPWKQVHLGRLSSEGDPEEWKMRGVRDFERFNQEADKKS